MTTSSIASISISGTVTLNLHALNNEGGEGNQIITRQLSIIDKEGQQHTVNGISGDMFKHIHANHLVNHAVEAQLPLSGYSKLNNPNRISAEDLLAYIKEKKAPNKSSADIIDAMINICTVCDLHGVLLTDKVGDNKSSSNTPRKSCIEYGWTIGIPEQNNTESYIHTKLVPDAGKHGSATSNNEGQNIFHRPANHGAYAFVCNLDAYRIGFNDISRTYAIDEPARAIRYKAAIKSLISSILNPKGAMTSTQKPHITDFNGILSYSRQLIPAPLISALNPDYKQEIQAISNSLNELEPESIVVQPFGSLQELTQHLVQLAQATPYTLQTS